MISKLVGAAFVYFKFKGFHAYHAYILHEGVSLFCCCRLFCFFIIIVDSYKSPSKLGKNQMMGKTLPHPTLQAGPQTYTVFSGNGIL